MSYNNIFRNSNLNNSIGENVDETRCILLKVPDVSQERYQSNKKNNKDKYISFTFVFCSAKIDFPGEIV